MMYCYLKRINENLEIRTIHHSNKEHGISKEVMNELKLAKPSLLIILDASANDSDQCTKLSKLGWRICVGEHHHSEKLNPNCQIIMTTHSPGILLNGWGQMVTEMDKITICK